MCLLVVVKIVLYSVGVIGGMLGLLILFNGRLLFGLSRCIDIVLGVSGMCVSLYWWKLFCWILLFLKLILFSVVRFRFIMQVFLSCEWMCLGLICGLQLVVMVVLCISSVLLFFIFILIIIVMQVMKLQCVVIFCVLFLGSLLFQLDWCVVFLIILCRWLILSGQCFGDLLQFQLLLSLVVLICCVGLSSLSRQFFGFWLVFVVSLLMKFWMVKVWGMLEIEWNQLIWVCVGVLGFFRCMLGMVNGRLVRFMFSLKVFWCLLFGLNSVVMFGVIE